MKLIIGLGNPGFFYRNSRHNIGFQAAKLLAKESKAAFKKDVVSLSAKAKIAGENIIIALPLTFMNLSGLAAARLLEKYRLASSQLLVVCDDMDLDFGQLKLSSGGSSAGHRGIESLIDCLKDDGFSRLRLGIGRPPAKGDASKFVLSSFSGRQRQGLRDFLGHACQACVSWIEEGNQKTMNRFNRRRDCRA